MAKKIEEMSSKEFDLAQSRLGVKPLEKMAANIPVRRGIDPMSATEGARENFGGGGRGGFAIYTRAGNKSGWKRVPDTQFDTKESAVRYGDKYHTDRYGAKMYKVGPHPGNK